MIGLGSYAYFWRHRAGLSLADALRDACAQGVGLFQICDYAPLGRLTAAELRDLRLLADDLGLEVELGIRGLGTGHLRRFLSIAAALRARLLRSMVDTAPAEAGRLLEAILPELESAGVTLALETYERIGTAELVALIEDAGHPLVGICLDPANPVAALEHPDAVIERARPHVKNVHVKDFAFSRRDGWVGFTLAGAPLGEGLLDIGHLLSAATPRTSLVVEHWLPWQGDAATTTALEVAWTSASLEYLRRT